MKPKERKVTFPIMGRKNSEVIGTFLEDLGLQVIMPPKTTDETIRTGAKYCANMVCYPLKVTLGNYIEALEQGANTLLAYDTQGACRFRQYTHLHNFTLTGLGYNFEMHTINKNNVVGKLSELSGRSRLTVLNKMRQYFRQIQENDRKSKQWSEDRPNIGIIGEIYCCCEDSINFGLEDKIRRYGGNPYNTATVTDFVSNKVPILNLFSFRRLFARDEKQEHKRRAKEYLQGFTAGHAYENLYNLLWLKDQGVDGVVHVLPLSCMPETTIEPYVNGICRDSKIPLLRIPIDENSAEANLETRLETFVELIKIKRDRK